MADLASSMFINNFRQQAISSDKSYKCSSVLNYENNNAVCPLTQEWQNLC